MIPKELEYSTIRKIHKNLSSFVIKTPIINHSKFKKNLFNTNLFFKLEFLQNSGCFKVRGALNNVFNLSKNQIDKGITAVSAGNHAIAVSYVAQKYSIKNKIFMYKTANPFKTKIVKDLKANLHMTDPTNAFIEVEKASKNEGFYFIHPFDGKYTVQGTASLGYEICQQISNIDNIIISVGGGGLISGVGSIIKQKFPNCKIIGVEPLKANGLTQSLEKGLPLKNIDVNSIADSLSAPLHAQYSFDICKNVINKMVNVSDDEMKFAMKYMFENYKMILEPACVAGIAALLGPLKNQLKNQNTLILLCGSNIDINSWCNLTSN